MKVLYKFVVQVILSSFFLGCISDDSYDIPDDLGVIENKNLEVLINPENGFQEKSIQQVKDMFVDGEVHQITSAIYIKGYVSSSDESGNFYKEIYLQDSPIEPQAGIRVLLNMNDVFGKYNLGREVYVNLKGLYIGESNSGNGIVSVGMATDYSSLTLNAVPESRANLQVLRSNNTRSIIAKELNILQLNTDYIGVFVTIDNVQFPSFLAGIASYVHPLDDYDTTISIASCDGFGNSSFILETSKFASFNDVSLPSGSGAISGILTRDYSGEKLVLVINSISDVNMNNTRCTSLEVSNFTFFLNEDFESMSNGTVSANGWTNFAEKGFNYWKIAASSDEGNLGSKIARARASYSDDSENVMWLVSPPIQLNLYEEEFLQFQTSNSFSDNSRLELLISTEWDGDLTTISSVPWQPLPATIVDDAENHERWIDSGAINLSSYEGVAHIAFKYKGGDNDTNQTGTYELDNFTILVR
jgi:hypothetical protein